MTRMKKKYKVERSPHFERELKKAQKRGLDVNEAEALIVRLSKGERLEPNRKDHALHGEYKGYRECHINPDWLLVYKKFEDKLILFLYRTGTHSDLFKS